MFSRLLRVAPVLLLTLGGCGTLSENRASMDPLFGESLAYDKAIQTIDPDPVYSDDQAKPGDRGDRGAQAVKRYRTDQVKQVETMQTSTSSGSSGPQE